MNSVLLQEALKEHNIPFPENKMRSGGFIRWGRNSRFWAYPVEDGFFFGDFVSGLSTGVFPNGKIQNGKAIEDYLEKAYIERELFYSAAKERAQKIWNEAPFLTCSHKYLERKRALNLGLKVSGRGAIIIPLKDIYGEIQSLQFINTFGGKSFLKNGRKSGNFFWMGKPVNNRIFLCEGYATACSIYQATKECTITCFDAGNLEKVGNVIKQYRPDCSLIFCADNDRFGPTNTGIEKATAAARALKGKVVFPCFDDQDTQSSDFNDLHCWYGLQFVIDQLQSVLGDK